MKKKLIRLTENDLHRIVKESVNNVLNESNIFDIKLPEVIVFLIELLRRLDDGLVDLDGYGTEQRIQTIAKLRDALSVLKDISNNHRLFMRP